MDNQTQTLEMPEAAVQGVEFLSRVSPEQFEMVMSGIAKAAPDLSRRKFINQVIAISGCREEVASNVVALATGMFSGCYALSLSKERFFTRFVNTLKKFHAEKFAAPVLDETITRLQRLWELDNPLGIVGKAQMLMAEHQNLFVTARLISDLRPIFTSEADQVPSTCMLVHKLHISHYDQGEDDSDTFFVLDSDDLRELKKIIDRALRKEKLLTDFAKRSNIALLDRTAGSEE